MCEDADHTPVEVEVGPRLAEARRRKGDGAGGALVPGGTWGHIHRHNAAGNVCTCTINCYSAAILHQAKQQKRHEEHRNDNTLATFGSDSRIVDMGVT